MTIEEIKAQKGMPDFRAKMESINFDYRSYFVFQKLGSHPVHGIWSDLMEHYLTWEDTEGFKPRDHNSTPHENQYLFTGLHMINTIESYLNYIVQPRYDAESFSPGLTKTREVLMDISKLTDKIHDSK